jgi:N6-L-threonylcarbamoyladenine synthase
MGNNMKILAIDTSCDETSAAVTQGTKIFSNIIWSQASLHAKFGGVYPTLAQREHKERIDWVINKAITYSQSPISQIDAIAVTTGPGLAIALGIGIDKARELSENYKKPLIPVNHVEGHFLSPLAQSKKNQSSMTNNQIAKMFPALGIVVSGGTTQVILAEKLGKYNIMASTIDDALGEALDKGARLLGLGYPGGAILEKFAKNGKTDAYPLPIPMLGREDLNKLSYSGLKTALVRLVEKTKKEKGSLDRDNIRNLAASYQNTAFTHLIRILTSVIQRSPITIHYLFVGGGVGANVELRKKIRNMCHNLQITPLFPYSKKLYTDNAAMIGVSAYFNYQQNKFLKPNQLGKIDRKPRAKITEGLF